MVRLAALALLAALLVVAAGALVACGDGSAPAPATRTLTPGDSPSPGKHGATASPSVQPTASATPTATTSPSPTASSTPARITDKSIKANILARIAQEPGLRGFEIQVVVSSGVVYLRGRVRTTAQRTLVEQIALSEPGVKKVVSAVDVDDAAGY
ncbi:MAG: BON domain-containing protein [Solirubrobacteraceae bacterium]|nr:BON domain-containing protein [Solirubrobacteraceae bacterium]